MSTENKHAVLIDASPRTTDASTSRWLATRVESHMNAQRTRISRIHVRESFTKAQTDQDFQTMLQADALIFVFPLYIFCLPGQLMRFLQDYDRYRAGRSGSASNPLIYAVVNCGFPEPDINAEAVRVIQSFAEKIRATFRFGVMIGSGPMLYGAINAPFMKKTRDELAHAFQAVNIDIVSNGQEIVEDYHIYARFPRKLYFFMGDKGWVSRARKNGLSKRDLYRKPYRE